MRGRVFVFVVACSIPLLLYNIFAIHFHVRPSESSSIALRSASRFAIGNPSIKSSSSVLSLAPLSPNQNSSPPPITHAIVLASSAPGVQLVEPARSSSADIICNHVRNPSFENRYAASSLLTSRASSAHCLSFTAQLTSVNRCCGDTQFPGWSEGIIASWPRFFVDCAVKRRYATSSFLKRACQCACPFSHLCSGDCSLRLQPGWAVQHVDVSQRSAGPITLLLHIKATGLEPQVCHPSRRVNNLWLLLTRHAAAHVHGRRIRGWQIPF